jgi:hypothetical protein
MEVTAAWRAAFPGALAGALIMRGVANPERCEPLEERKRELEDELRSAEPDAARRWSCRCARAT